MEFHSVKESLCQAIAPISKLLVSIVLVGAAFDAAKMGKHDWVGISEVNAGSPLGWLWHFCNVLCEEAAKFCSNCIHHIPVWYAEEGRLLIIVLDI